AEGIRMHVVKRDGRREPFDREKLLRGLQRAAAKRPIEPERLEEVVDSIASAVRRRGGEAPAEWVGELALGGLARLDRVAAVMFASVYRSIEDLSAFEAELRRLESEPLPGPDQLAIEVLQGDVVPSAQESTLATPLGGPSSARRNPKKKQRRGHASHP
ncbi:MAG TPA: ATP cone domain-containing protein, partial [Conexibacter sp.]